MEKYYNMEKSKAGQGHVEMIISFVIFVGFILAIFIFINPVQTPQTSYVSLDLVQEILMANLSSQIQSVPLVVAGVNKSCFIINNSFNNGGNLLVRDFNGNLVPSKVEGDKLYIKNVTTKLYTLYYSDFLENYSDFSFVDCQTLTNNLYKYGFLINENRIFIKNILDLNQDYLRDYSDLKSELKITSDFDFVVYNLSRGIVSNDSLTIHKIRNGNNLVREIPLRILNGSASEQDILLSLRVW